MSAAVVCQVCGETLRTEGDADTLEALAFSAGYEQERCAECAPLNDQDAAQRRSEVLSHVATNRLVPAMCGGRRM